MRRSASSLRSTTLHRDVDGTETVALARRPLLLAAALVVLSRLPAWAADNAAVPVEQLHAGLLDAARSGTSVAARREFLEPVVRETFDFATMSRVAVGSAWAGFDAGQQEALADAFAAFAATNYAASFDDAEGLSFKTLGERPGENERVWVDTELERPGGDPVAFAYLVQSTGDGPRIVNVVVDGAVNELARRRAEFRALLNDGGLDRLLNALAERVRAAGG